ncbi:MAG: hypothetical protein IMW96_11410 [Thermoanaerobacteraceae bacterium]|nr:hypothetical protein [Thermoanaerobacteraceae bacterium]
MLCAVICTSDRAEAVRKAVVSAGYQLILERITAGQNDFAQALNAGARVAADVLVLELPPGLGEEIIRFVEGYRMLRPTTRIIVLAPGRSPGDPTVAAIVHMGIYDIIAGLPEADWENLAHEALTGPPADYSRAAAWLKASPPRKEWLKEALVAVWSPSGCMVSLTALNLAVAAARMGYDVALLNFNLANPETDFWFGVRQTEPAKCRMEDAGIMTFGTSMTAELAIKILEKRKKIWGIRYLPAGNKLRNIGTPDFSSEHVELFREMIAAAHSREAGGPKLTVVEAGSWFEQPPVFAALFACPIVIVPMAGGEHEKAVLEMLLTDLKRLEVKLEVIEFYPLDAVGTPKGSGKKPLALEGDPAPWQDLLSAIARQPQPEKSGSGVFKAVSKCLFWNRK